MCCPPTGTSQFDVLNSRYRTARGHDKTCRPFKIFVPSNRNDDRVYCEVSSCSVFFICETHMTFIRPWYTARETIHCRGMLVTIRRNTTYTNFHRVDILRLCVNDKFNKNKSLYIRDKLLKEIH
jgi:hypothetical protein